MRWILLIPVFLFLSGCHLYTGTYTVDKEYTIPEGSNKGLVIISFTQPFGWMKWMYHDLREDKGLALNEDFFDTYPKANKLIENGSAIIFATDLPEGEYEIYSWTALSGGSTFQSIKHFSIRFKCTAGKATYVGNLFMRFYGNNFNMLIRDDSDKEMPLIRKNFRNIRDDQIEVQLMEYKEGKKEGSSRKSTPEAPIRQAYIRCIQDPFQAMYPDRLIETALVITDANAYGWMDRIAR